MKWNNHKEKVFWILYHAGFVVFAAGTGMLMKYLQTGDALHPTWVVSAAVIYIMSSCIGYLAVFMVRKAEKYDHNKLKKRLLPLLVLFYAASYLIANLAITLGALGWFLYIGRDMEAFFPHLFQNELNFGKGSFFIWLMVFTIFFFYFLWRKSVTREQSLMEESLKYRYNTLKAQINPHFLFNSLNTLSELIYKEPSVADNYLQKLASVYRYILDNEENSLVPLENELAFVEDYYNMQKERGTDKIILTVERYNKGSFLVIPVSIQMLLENALKHNAASKDSPLDIRIAINHESISVSNNIQRKQVMGQSTKTGLKNLSERVRLITGKEMEISEKNNTFKVTIPLISDHK
ncbi:MAG: histidine kinase [Bacteroidales bacterium]|nr:histidine kinase [Bacteroidales bacterium]